MIHLEIESLDNTALFTHAEEDGDLWNIESTKEAY